MIYTGVMESVEGYSGYLEDVNPDDYPIETEEPANPTEETNADTEPTPTEGENNG